MEAFVGKIIGRNNDTSQLYLHIYNQYIKTINFTDDMKLYVLDFGSFWV